MTIVPCVKAWNWSCYKPIVRLIREKGIEVVSLQYVPHGFHPKGLPFPLIQLVRKIKKCNIKLFTFCHELYVGKEKGNFKRNLLNFLMRNITKCIILQSDFIATSINIHKIIIKELTNNQKRVSIIPISSNIPTGTKSTDELKALKKWIAPQKEIIISFLDNYKNVQNNLRYLQVKNFSDEDYKKLGLNFSRIAKEHHIIVQTCGEKKDLVEYGFIKDECLSRSLAYKLTGKNFPRWQVRNNKNCNCANMVDIGSYNSCLHLCKYCYANYDESSIRANVSQHDVNSSLLIGNLNNDDIIKVRRK